MTYLNAKSPQVQALLGGATQIRVPVKPPPHPLISSIQKLGEYGFKPEWSSASVDIGFDEMLRHNKCFVPPYRVGQRVGVREAWCRVGAGLEVNLKFIRYRIDIGVNDHQHTWRLSRHLPDWAIRLWFEISAVRVEKCSEISEEDALKCGVKWQASDVTQDRRVPKLYWIGDTDAYSSAEKAFSSLHNALYPWETSWVWVFDGKVIRK